MLTRRSWAAGPAESGERLAQQAEENLARLNVRLVNEGRRGPQTGTRALMLAVLDNGISCYLGDEPRERAEAEYWVSCHHHHSPFAFAVVCETLGLEPGAVRAALKRLREGDVPHNGNGRRRPNVRREGRLTARKTG